MDGNVSEKDFAEEGHMEFRESVQTVKAETERNVEYIYSMSFKHQQNSLYISISFKNVRVLIHGIDSHLIAAQKLQLNSAKGTILGLF